MVLSMHPKYKKKVKKSKRPSAVHVMEEAEAAGAGSAQAAGGGRSEVEVVIVDGAVEEEGGEKVARVTSLGKVELGGSEVVVSEEGFVTALGKSGLSLGQRCGCWD